MVGSKDGEGRAGTLLKSRCDAGQACVSRHNDDTVLVTSSHSWTKLELRETEFQGNKLTCLQLGVSRHLRLGDFFDSTSKDLLYYILRTAVREGGSLHATLWPYQMMSS